MGKRIRTFARISGIPSNVPFHQVASQRWVRLVHTGVTSVVLWLPIPSEIRTDCINTP